MTLAVGKNVNAGVYGGLTTAASDYGALPIDSKTGLGSAGGDITTNMQLSNVGLTLGALLGVDAATMAAKVTQGKVIEAALA